MKNTSISTSTIAVRGERQQTNGDRRQTSIGSMPAIIISSLLVAVVGSANVTASGAACKASAIAGASLTTMLTSAASATLSIDDDEAKPQREQNRGRTTRANRGAGENQSADAQDAASATEEAGPASADTAAAAAVINRDSDDAANVTSTTVTTEDGETVTIREYVLRVRVIPSTGRRPASVLVNGETVDVPTGAFLVRLLRRTGAMEPGEIWGRKMRNRFNATTGDEADGEADATRGGPGFRGRGGNPDDASGRSSGSGSGGHGYGHLHGRGHGGAAGPPGAGGGPDHDRGGPPQRVGLAAETDSDGDGEGDKGRGENDAAGREAILLPPPPPPADPEDGARSTDEDDNLPPTRDRGPFGDRRGRGLFGSDDPGNNRSNGSGMGGAGAGRGGAGAGAGAGAGPGIGGGGAGRGRFLLPDVPELTPETVDRVLTVVAEFEPDRADHLARMQQVNPTQFMREMRQEQFRWWPAVEMRDQDRERYDLMLEDHELTRRTLDLQIRYRQAVDAPEPTAEDLAAADTIKDQMRLLVDRHFMVRQALKERELQDLAGELELLQSRLERRLQMRDQIVTQRVAWLLGPSGDF